MDRERLAVALFLLIAGGAIALALLAPDGRRQEAPATVPLSELPREGAPEATPAAIPIFPGAVSIAPPEDAVQLLEAVDGEDLTCPVSGVDAVFVSPELWLAPPGPGPSPFAFYERRMRPVAFEEMGREFRALIGLRPAGPVDSPPLLYVSPGGALLIRPSDDGALTLLRMFC